MRRFQIVCLALSLAAAGSGLAAGQLGGGIASDVHVARTLDDIEATEARKQRLDSELKSLAQKRAATHGTLRDRVRTLYRITKAGAPLAGGFKSMLKHASRVKRIKGLIEANAKQLQALNKRGHELRAQAGEAGAHLQQAREQLAAMQSGSGRRRERRQDDFMRVLSAERSAYRPAQPQGNHFYGMRLVGQEAMGRGFASKRGQLASPVSGDVRIADSRRAESDGPGLEFQAPVGTPVRAVAAGRVAFSDRYGSYGRLVIVDHGDGYYSVYGGLGAVEVRVGDDLSRRARIGSIGTEWNPSALFFEVRKGTRTLAPRGWLGL